MKKGSALRLFALAAIVFAVTGCSKGGNSTSNENSDDTTPTSQVTETTSGTASANPDTIKISTAEQFQAMAGNLAGDYELQNSIVLAEGFLPIGNFQLPFTGRLNGNGHTISNIRLNLTAASYAMTPNNDSVRLDATIGLFGATKGAYLENLSLGNVEISGAPTNIPDVAASKIRCYVGGLSGYANDTVIRHVAIDGFTANINNVGEAEMRIGTISGWLSGDIEAADVKNISMNVTSRNETRIGGLAGNIDDGTISNSIVRVNSIILSVTNDKAKLGGVTGTTEKGTHIYLVDVSQGTLSASSASKQAFAGGIAAVMEDGKVENCHASAAILSTASGDKPAYAGGIAGTLEDEVGNPKIMHCVASGAVTAKSTGASINSFAGGIAGRFEGISGPSNEFSITLRNSYASGNVTATATKNANGAAIIGALTFADSSNTSDYISKNLTALYYGKQTVIFSKTNAIGTQIANFDMATIGLSDAYWNYENSSGISLKIDL